MSHANGSVLEIEEGSGYNFSRKASQGCGSVSRWKEKNVGQKHLLSLLSAYRLKKLLNRLLDENEFLSDYGICTLSKYFEQNPYTRVFNGGHFTIEYPLVKAPLIFLAVIATGVDLFGIL